MHDPTSLVPLLLVLFHFVNTSYGKGGGGHGGGGGGKGGGGAKGGGKGSSKGGSGSSSSSKPKAKKPKVIHSAGGQKKCVDPDTYVFPGFLALAS